MGTSKIFHTSPAHVDLDVMIARSAGHDTPSDIKDHIGVITDNGNVRWKTRRHVDTYIGELPEGGVDGYTVHPAFEGTVVRMFTYRDNWILATSKSLNAFDVRWGSNTSVGDTFVNTLDRQYGIGYKTFYESLNNEYMYVFFVTRAKDDRIVCRSPVHKIYHSETHTPTGLVDIDIGIEKLPRLDVGDILRYVADSDPYEVMGLLLCKGEHKICVKSRAYADLEKIRAGRSCLIQRYLEVRHDIDMYKPFVSLYPEHAETFRGVELDISHLVRVLAGTFRNIGDRAVENAPAWLQDMFRRCREENPGSLEDTELYFTYEVMHMHPASLIYLI